MLLVCRFDVGEDAKARFLERAESALRLLTACDGCRDGELARATEDDESWVMVVRFDSVAGYRRAMSGVDVRHHVIPLLSEARVNEPSAHEPVVTASAGATERHTSLLAKDAGTVRPGTTGRTEPR